MELVHLKAAIMCVFVCVRVHTCVHVCAGAYVYTSVYAYMWRPEDNLSFCFGSVHLCF